MSLWLVLLLGIVAGVLIGIISGRSNYADCREIIKELEQEVHDKSQKLDEAQTEIDHLKHRKEDGAGPSSPAESDQPSAAPPSDE